MINYMLNGKTMKVNLKVEQIKKENINKGIFSEPKSLGGKEKAELDLSNYARKRDLKNAVELDTLSFAKKVNLANLKLNIDKLDTDKLKNFPTNLNNLKSKADKLDVDKLVPLPFDLGKLSDVIKK